MSPARVLLVLAAMALLGACATRGPASAPLPVLAPAAVAAAMDGQVAREARLAGTPAWTLSGRAAITRDGKGGNGRIDWQQDGAGYRVELSAPVTRQGWRLSSSGSGARLEGLDGGPREGPDGSQLLYEATGLEVPMAALGAWLRGARADEARHGPATLAFGADLLPARLQQDGWVIEFRAWHEGDTITPPLPRRIEARRGGADVRLVIDQWGGIAP
ncbi:MULTISPECIES: lipoprotein insertase outer membrane protein LolB [unclassified Luteimonas]|uniref:lipoprotein insertase outer membrane protein LolB n=1 Tax=unclassified Luteimonas TaxID=2629088 RepID=UPI001603EB0C|nr:MULTISPECIES: lipoprotein insertase outer membrane protein LolB [unclassified Luteimonas]MBB1473919.1 outer membrane lipoprotein LolB [Luteimonas sp. MC1782]MBB6599851.1 outer membrane lipoprotein LolB [Luteimonas sp. MC1825]QOC87569.1 outer membrane lipoprotein LolB [Luteimonas sp. MC1825]